MPEKIRADLKACETCKVGSCCYEGVSVTVEEMERINQFAPDVPKPWFRPVTKEEDPEYKQYPFTTALRNGTCVFQDADNRCMVYAVRPQFCRDFPLEYGATAPHYTRLCVLFHEQWPDNSVRRTLEAREKK